MVVYPMLCTTINVYLQNQLKILHVSFLCFYEFMYVALSFLFLQAHGL